MSRETASRDLSLNALAVITGGLTAATFVGTGLVTGLAADYTAQKTQAKALSKAASAPLAPQPVATPRPVRTVVTTRYVQGKASAANGQVSTRASGNASSVTSSQGAAAAPAPQRAPAPAAAPAPSAAS